MTTDTTPAPAPLHVRTCHVCSESDTTRMHPVIHLDGLGHAYHHIPCGAADGCELCTSLIESES